MSSEGPIRVRLRYADLDTFVEKFAPNVSRGGLFLASRTPRAVGDIFRFEVMLSDGRIALAGDGKVTWVRDFDPAQPQKPHGMGVQFVRIDPESRATLERILQLKQRNSAAPAARSQAPAPSARPGAGHPAVARGPEGPEVVPLRAVTPGPVLDRDALDASLEVLMTEAGLDDAALKRILERARKLGPKLEDLEALAQNERDPPVTRERALAELPRLLARGPDTAPGRRRTGQFRVLPDEPAKG
jgi:uncharacterized protein (TIGR02266 family)